MGVPSILKKTHTATFAIRVSTSTIMIQIVSLVVRRPRSNSEFSAVSKERNQGYGSGLRQDPCFSPKSRQLRTGHPQVEINLWKDVLGGIRLVDHHVYLGDLGTFGGIELAHSRGHSIRTSFHLSRVTTHTSLPCLQHLFGRPLSPHRFSSRALLLKTVARQVLRIRTSPQIATPSTPL